MAENTVLRVRAKKGTACEFFTATDMTYCTLLGDRHRFGHIRCILSLSEEEARRAECGPQVVKP